MRVPWLISFFFSLLIPISVLAGDQTKNTYDLIEEALARKTITQAQAILYRALALRGDPGLPEELIGNPSVAPTLVPESDLHIGNLSSALAALTASEQVSALRMMAPPSFVPGLADLSANPTGDSLPSPAPDPSWKKLEATEFVVWYSDTDPKAALYLPAIVSAFPQVLAKLSFMSKKPLSDENESFDYETKDGKKVTIGNGGDGRIDIFLMPMGRGASARGYAQPYERERLSDPRPGFLVLNTSINLSVARMKSVLMHETMHLVQFAYPMKMGLGATSNINEGVAKWSEDVWDSGSQFEHEWVQFFRNGATSLKSASYGTWTWYYFLVHELGTFIIDRIYLSMADKGPYDAMNASIPGGFMDMWPGYTKKEWNQYPPEDNNSFKTWDDFSEVPQDLKGKDVKPNKIDIDLTKGAYVYQENVSLKTLSRKYVAFEFAEMSLAHSLSIGMTHFWAKSKVTLRAMVEYESGWKYVKWDDQYEDREICLDRKNERIKQFVLIYSNFDHRDTSGPAEFASSVVATNMPCNGWQGHVESSMELKNSNGTMSITATTDATFKAADSKVEDANSGPHFPGIFHLFSLKTKYHIQATTTEGCSGVASDSIEVAGDRLKKVGNIGLYPYNGPSNGNYRTISAAIGHPLPEPIQLRMTCPGGRNYLVPVQLSLLTTEKMKKLEPGSAVLHGKHEPIPGLKWKYRFVPVELN
jgi:hypothetical protein